MPEQIRHLPFETSFNFRDLGGYRTKDGRQVRWHTLYRSDSLHRFTDADRKLAADINLQTVIDLRSTDEVTQWGPSLQGPNVAVHHLPLFEQDALPFEPVGPSDPEPPEGGGPTYYAIASAGGAAISAAIEVIAYGDHPVVIHCAAGKDRTGILVALILSALGVSDSDVAADYSLSDAAISRAGSWFDANSPEEAAQLRAMPAWLLLSRQETMRAFLTLLRRHHGSVRSYLGEIGVDRGVLDELERRLTEQSSALA
jgi:protein-tyrosine phosphatase